MCFIAENIIELCMYIANLQIVIHFVMSNIYKKIFYCDIIAHI